MSVPPRKSERQRGAFALLVMALGIAFGTQIPLWRIYDRLVTSLQTGVPIEPGHARAYVVFLATAIGLQLLVGVPLMVMARATGDGDAWLRTWWRGVAVACALVIAVEGVAALLLLRG